MLERSNGREETGFLLSLLDAEIRSEVLKASTSLTLSLGDKLFSAGQRIDRVLFLASGIASIVVVSRSGRKTESGIVGHEGFIPTGALAGAEENLTEIVVQAPGKAVAMDMEVFRSLMAKHQIFSDIVICASHVARTQVECTAAANATGTVSQRLARWLLMSRPRAWRPATVDPRFPLADAGGEAPERDGCPARPRKRTPDPRRESENHHKGPASAGNIYAGILRAGRGGKCAGIRALSCADTRSGRKT